MALTEQEVKFAEDFVYLYFNGGEKAFDRIGMKAAIAADYTIPENQEEARIFIKTLLGETEGSSPDIRNYIDELIASFRKKLSINNRRTVWELISKMEV